MPTTPLPDALRDLISRPNPCVMATVRRDGRPVTVATWYVYDRDSNRILVNLDESRTRLQHLRNDPHVAVTVLDGDSWYTHVSVQGHVDEIVDDVELTDVDRVAKHYTGKPYAVRDRKRVSVWIAIDRWSAWNAPGE